MTKQAAKDRHVAYYRSELGYIKFDRSWVCISLANVRYHHRLYRKAMRRHERDIIEEQLADMDE